MMQLSETLPITELMDPLAVRLGMKSTYTGNAEELVGEMLQNAQRAGARHVRFTTHEQGFDYFDDGHGLRDITDFESVIRLGQSGWGQQIRDDQQPLGMGTHALLAHDGVESVTVSISISWQRLPTFLQIGSLPFLGYEPGNCPVYYMRFNQPMIIISGVGGL